MHWTDPWTVGDGLYDTCIKLFKDFILNGIPYLWVEPSLCPSRGMRVLLLENAMHAQRGINSLKVRQVLSDCFLPHS